MQIKLLFDQKLNYDSKPRSISYFRWMIQVTKNRNLRCPFGQITIFYSFNLTNQNVEIRLK